MMNLGNNVFKHSKSLMAIASVAATLGFAAISPAQENFLDQDFVAEAAVVEVAIGAGQFLPNKLTIHVGDSIKWTNTTAVTHTVTADPAIARKASDVILPEGATPFHSGPLTPNQVFTHEFTVPGLYQYVCVPHELHGMIAQVEVLP